jgi:hypothetical protein
MTKYQQAYEEMIMGRKADFEVFKKIHDLYKTDQTRWKEEFDRLGKPLLRIIEEEESRLCMKMEGGGKGKFSSKVAEKFREEVKKNFPLIDLVGVKFE